MQTITNSSMPSLQANQSKILKQDQDLKQDLKQDLTQDLEFYNMIKQFLYTRIYIEYQLCKGLAATSFDNPELWNTIFNKYATYIKYYTLLRTKMEHQQIEKNTNRCHFPSQAIFEEENPHLFSYKTNQYSIYEVTSFQEYVDKLILTMSLSSKREYNTFIQNMHDPQFKQKVITRHENEQYMNTIKNNIVYVLYLKINPRKYSFTIQQYKYLTHELQFLNLAPYFKYLAKMDLHQPKIDLHRSTEQPQTKPDIIQTDNISIKQFQYYEEHALGLIKMHIS